MTSRCCSKEQSVLVAVYAEIPRRSHPLLKGERRGGHHHHYQDHFHQNISRNDARVRGYSRKAELLHYARHLRASAKSAAASASAPSHPISHTNQLSTVQISTADRKQTRSSRPNCVNRWQCLIPGFLRSTTAFNAIKDEAKKNHKKSVCSSTKMMALAKNLKVQIKGSFLSELLRTLKKYR